MSLPNPSSAGVPAISNVNPAILRTLAAKYSKARISPPTVLRTLCTWPRLPGLAIVGTVSTATIGYLSQVPDSGISTHWIVGCAAIFVGAACRDIGLAIRVVRFWPAHSQFIDWNKVDEFSQ